MRRIKSTIERQLNLMQTVILAAEMGKRLKELTSNAAECMVEVNGVTMMSTNKRALSESKNQPSKGG